MDTIHLRVETILSTPGHSTLKLDQEICNVNLREKGKERGGLGEGD
jgi:hypothetical protein